MARPRTYLQSPLLFLPSVALVSSPPRLSARKSPRRPPRHAHPVARASSAEEELFIRRTAAPPVSTTTPSDPTPPTTTPPAAADAAPAAHADETFDYVHVAGEAAPPPIARPPQTPVLEGVPPIPGVPREATRASPQPENPPPKPLHIAVAPGLRSLAARVKRESARFITESSTLSHVRMPTHRETVLFTWELSLIVAVLLLLRAGVASTLRWIHNRLNATRGLKNNIPYEASVFECMQRPLEFLSLFTVGTALADAVSRPLAASGLLRHIRTLRELGIIISATWFLLKWIDRIRSRFAVDKRIDKAQMDATSRIATVITFGASLLISLDTIGINVQTVLAFGGIGGVAIGFAGREIISNFFGGFMIYVTRPFSVGEWIRSIEEAELNGTVEDIGWYLTRVRTWDKRPLYIPNSRFSTLIVENGSRMDNRRILHTLHLRHEDVPVATTIVSAMEQLLMSHPELDPRQHRLAYVDSFSDYSVKIWLSCYTKSVFLYDFRRVQQDILVKCYDIIRANGAKLATVNTRDVRPGADTDQYGPFGRNATFRQATPTQQLQDSSSRTVPVNSDVPGAPSYGRPNPAVRFTTIESGVDFSRIGEPSMPNSGLANGNEIRVAVPPVVGGSNKAQGTVTTASSADAASQRHASVAAVAAAAAALQAGLKNVSSRNQENGTSGHQTQGAAGTKVEATMGSGDGKGSTGPSSGGEMKITAGKPPRGSSGSGQTAVSNQSVGAGSVKIGSSKSAEERFVGPSSERDEVGQAAKVGSINTTGSSGPAEMMISKGRKQSPFGQGSSDGSRQESKESEMVAPREGGNKCAENGERPGTGSDNQVSTGESVQMMKISGAKAGRAASSGTHRGVGTAGTSSRSSSSESGGNETGGGSMITSGQGQKDAGGSGQPSVNRAAVAGEMKISKARKPATRTQVVNDMDGKGAGQSCPGGGGSKQETNLRDGSGDIEQEG